MSKKDFEVEEYDYYEEEPIRSYTQWNQRGSTFVPCSPTVAKIKPGFYSIAEYDGQYFFNRVNFTLSGLLKFPSSNAEEIIDDIEYFWSREEHFRKYKFPFKRSVFMSGPQGTGKTSIIKIIIKKVIDQGGVCIRFDNPCIFNAGMEALRTIQPDLPVVVIMEDFDKIIGDYNVSMILNIMDGAGSFDKIVYLATTNEPSDIPDNFLDRPGRFARHFVIDVPCAKSREFYFKTKLFSEDMEGIDIDKWVKDTEGFSVDHLHALIEQVVVMGYGYDKSIKELQSMKEGIKEDSDDDDDDDDDDDCCATPVKKRRARTRRRR